MIPVPFKVQPVLLIDSQGSFFIIVVSGVVYLASAFHIYLNSSRDYSFKYFIEFLLACVIHFIFALLNDAYFLTGMIELIIATRTE